MLRHQAKRDRFWWGLGFFCGGLLVTVLLPLANMSYAIDITRVAAVVFLCFGIYLLLTCNRGLKDEE